VKISQDIEINTSTSGAIAKYSRRSNSTHDLSTYLKCAKIISHIVVYIVYLGTNLIHDFTTVTCSVKL